MGWQTLLGPGRFVAESLIDFILMFQPVDATPADGQPIDPWAAIGSDAGGDRIVRD